MDIKTVKGVIGSLIKKDMMQAEEDIRDGRLFKDIFVKVGGHTMSFGSVNSKFPDYEDCLLK